LSGSELNKATRTINYSNFSTYAVIFWDKDEASVIKISSFTNCGSVVTQKCIVNSFSNLDGEDQKGRGWQICTKTYCL